MAHPHLLVASTKAFWALAGMRDIYLKVRTRQRIYIFSVLCNARSCWLCKFCFNWFLLCVCDWGKSLAINGTFRRRTAIKKLPKQIVSCCQDDDPVRDKGKQGTWKEVISIDNQQNETSDLEKAHWAWKKKTPVQRLNNLNVESKRRSSN